MEHKFIFIHVNDTILIFDKEHFNFLFGFYKFLIRINKCLVLCPS